MQSLNLFNKPCNLSRSILALDTYKFQNLKQNCLTKISPSDPCNTIGRLSRSKKQFVTTNPCCHPKPYPPAHPPHMPSATSPPCGHGVCPLLVGMLESSVARLAWPASAASQTPRALTGQQSKLPSLYSPAQLGPNKSKVAPVPPTSSSRLPPHRRLPPPCRPAQTYTPDTT